MQNEYPLNLFDAIVESTVYAVNVPKEITPDVLFGLQYALSLLKAREQMVLELRYKEGETFNRIGQLFSVSVSRVRQIEIVALRKLRQPDRWKFVEHGVQGVIKMEVANAYERGYSDGFDKGYASRAKAQPIESAKEEFTKEKLGLPIDKLGISSRVYNCLWFYGCRTIGDVVKMSYDQIYRLRNFGVVSRLEVRQALHNFNIYNTDWEEKRK